MLSTIRSARILPIEAPEIRCNPIPVCSHINNYDGRSAVDDGPLSVDGLGVRLRGFRKSHQLIPASSKLFEAFGGLPSAATHRFSRGPDPRMRINIIKK
jgi:hypothetical protein